MAEEKTLRQPPVIKGASGVPDAGAPAADPTSTPDPVPEMATEPVSAPAETPVAPVPTPPEPPAAPESKSAPKAAPKAEAIDNLSDIKAQLAAMPKYKLKIPSTEKDREPVPVNVCGYLYLIQRDKEVVVPYAVIHILENSIQTDFYQAPRGDGEDGYELVPVQHNRHGYMATEVRR